MVVDTSAVLAIVLEEAEGSAFLETLLNTRGAVMGAPTLFECQLVAQRRSGAELVAKLGAVLNALQLSIVSFGPEHEKLATAAFLQFGKGMGRAQLNFGDCLSYAIAKARNEPLLFKGDDFRHTDIRAAI